MAKCLLLTQSGHQHAVAQAVEEPTEFYAAFICNFFATGAKIESCLHRTALATLPVSRPSSFNANFSRTNFNVARVGMNYRV
jgi:hypothetical protein